MNKKLLESKKAIIMEKRNVTSTPRQTSSLKKNVIYVIFRPKIRRFFHLQ